MNKDFEKLCKEVLEEAGFFDRIRATLDARKVALDRPEYKEIKARTAANSIVSKFKSRIFKINEKYSRLLHNDRARFFKAADDEVKATARDLKKILADYKGVKIRDHEAEKIEEDFRQMMYNFYNQFFKDFKGAFETLLDNIDKYSIESTYVSLPDAAEERDEDEEEEDTEIETDEEEEEEEEPTPASITNITNVAPPVAPSTAKLPIVKEIPKSVPETTPKLTKPVKPKSKEIKMGIEPSGPVTPVTKTKSKLRKKAPKS